MDIAEYGHMHLSIFYRKVLVCRENGLTYKDKFYPWASIQEIEVWQEPWPGWGRVPEAKLLPRARLLFADGEYVLLRGDALVKHGQSLKAGFSSAFNELVSHLKDTRRSQLGNVQHT
jgi:hypothetical protein